MWLKWICVSYTSGKIRNTKELNRFFFKLMQYVRSISHRKEVFSMHNLLRTHRLRILYFSFKIFNLPSLLILSATNIIIMHPVRFVPEKMQFERFWKTSRSGDAL